MQNNLHETRERQFPSQPAEACSELGYVPETRPQPAWIARWLQVTRQWFEHSRRNR